MGPKTAAICLAREAIAGREGRDVLGGAKCGEGVLPVLMAALNLPLACGQEA